MRRFITATLAGLFMLALSLPSAYAHDHDDFHHGHHWGPHYAHYWHYGPWAYGPAVVPYPYYVPPPVAYYPPAYPAYPAYYPAPVYPFAGLHVVIR